MACDLTTTLDAACTSGIGKLQSQIKLLQTWAQLVCSGGTPCVPLDAPVATAASASTTNGFTANWTAVPGAVTYYLDVSTDPLFGSFLLGYNGLAVSAPTVSQSVVQIGRPECYYRVRASALPSGDLSCPSENSNVITAPLPPVVSLLGTGSTTSDAVVSISTGSISPSSNALLLAFCYGPASDLADSVTGNGLTWVRCADRDNASRRVTVFRALGAAPTPGVVTVNYPAASGCGYYVSVIQITSVDPTGTNGSGAINQWVWSDVNNVTCAPFNVDGLSVAIGAGIEAVNPCTASAEAGWTQDVNAAQTGASSSMGMFVAHKVGTTDATFASSMAGSCISVAFEIKTAAQSNNVVDPSTISNLGVWLKSDAGTFQDAAKAVPCTNGTTVYTWANQGSIAADAVQPTLAQRPVYNTGGGVNSLPRLTWAGAEGMLLTSGSIAQPITIFAVLKYVSNAGGYGPVVWDTPVNFQLAFENATGTRPYMNAGSTVAAITASDMGGLPGNISCIYQNNTDEFYVNYAPARQMLAFATGPNGITTAMHIGGYNNGGQHMNGDYYELLVFSRRLTQIERVQVQNYINRKYNF